MLVLYPFKLLFPKYLRKNLNYMDLVNAVKLEVDRKKTASRPNATKHFEQNAYLGRVKNVNLAAKAYFIIVTLWHCRTYGPGTITPSSMHTVSLAENSEPSGPAKMVSTAASSL